MSAQPLAHWFLIHAAVHRCGNDDPAIGGRLGIDASSRFDDIDVKAVRAHGNAAEYVPIFVALFLYFLLSGAGGWIEWVAIIVTASRVLHALGMLMTQSFNRPPHALRAVGALGTYVGGLMLGVALLMAAFV